jgi:glucose-1-phosphate thymidylyltransferase
MAQDKKNSVDRGCRKGILLAGGAGTRLFPLTKVINKHLLAVHDKPMIYYSLATLMLAGIRDILLITSPDAIEFFRDLFGDGRAWGLTIQYAEQQRPAGIAEALLIGETFIGTDSVCLVLGDNIFYGHGLPEMLQTGAAATASGACIFSYQVADPSRYGVVTLDAAGKPLDITEKPRQPMSNFAVTGLYFYNSDAVAMAKTLKPSGRSELEITDINRLYLARGQLTVQSLGRGFVWFDTGTPTALAYASRYIEIVQDRQNTGIAFPEEIAYRMGFIKLPELSRLVEKMGNSAYQDYLARLVSEETRLSRS